MMYINVTPNKAAVEIGIAALEEKRVYFDHRFQMVGWGPAIKKENVFQKVAESVDRLFAR